MKRWEFISSSSAAQGQAGHWSGGGEHHLFVHHFLCTLIHIYLYIVITIILYFFSVLVNSFISSHDFYFLFPVLSPIPLGRGTVSN